MKTAPLSRIVAAFVVLTLFSPLGLEAGSVFLKNGYILQGKIVDRTEGSVVLSWENGRVTIADRFIDEVLLDPSEEELIRRRKDLEAAEARRSSVVVEDLVLSKNDVMRLPDSFQEILGATADGRSAVTHDGSDDGVDSDSVGSWMTTKSGLEVEVMGLETIPQPNFLEKKFESIGVELSLPSDWIISEKMEAIRISDPENGERHYLTIDRWSGTPIAESRAAELTAESLESNFPSIVCEEGDVRYIDEKPAKTLVCRAASDAIQCEQYLLKTDAGLYILGSYQSTDSESEEITILDRVINSIHFSID